MFTDFIMFLHHIKSKYRVGGSLYRTIYSSILIMYILSSFVFVCVSTEECVGSQCLNLKKEIIAGGSGVGAHLSLSSGLSEEPYVLKRSESLSQAAKLEVHACRGGRTKLTSLEGYMTDGAGNYSQDIRCTWLIESGQRGLPIKLSFEHLATECAWDHIYVYDGDSAFSPKVAAFSGLVLKPGYARHRHEVTTHSGSTYVYFYSDAAVFMTGFNITYTVNSTCAASCSLHGQCVNAECRCHVGWAGPDCMTSLCPDNCGPGRCHDNKWCVCPDGFHGSDCSVSVSRSVWTRVHLHSPLAGRASLAAVAHRDVIYYLGGYSWDDEQTALPVLRYSTKTRLFEELSTSEPRPSSRYGHSAVLYKDSIYVYGGSTGQRTAMDELWIFDLIGQRWSQPTNQDEPSIDVTGHTAHVIGGKMYVIFGYSPVYGYVPYVQKYDIASGTWSVSRTAGATVTGAYGAASVYEPRTETVYVHAGYRLAITGAKTDDLYSFHVHTETWRVLRSTGQVRHLHSAVMIDGLMLIFGGNTDNDANISTGAECYSNDFIAYDTWCDRWLTLRQPSDLGYTARYGHTATLHDRSVYVFGGFNGQLLSDLIKYSPGRCAAHQTKSQCLSANQGLLCVWSQSQCVPLSVGVANNGTDVSLPICPSRDGGKIFGDLSIECSRQKTCSSCVVSSAQCQWCSHAHPECMHGACPMEWATSAGCSAQEREREQCQLLMKCEACHVLDFCQWGEDNKCAYIGVDREAMLRRFNKTAVQCPAPCASHTSCAACTFKDCMWCASTATCADSDAYLATFPYGQCLDWSTRTTSCDASACGSIKECWQCQAHPECGWCDDGSGTGRGRCMYGGNSGALDTNTTTTGRQVAGTCPRQQWFFTECPRCQCNGHSRCDGDTDRCIHCEGNTSGKTCEYCKRGFWGSAINGGKCAACECNEHAQTCDQTYGKCQCQTKGIVGTKCDRCDSANNYFGQPNNGGTCYYKLATDFEIRFNLSSHAESHVTKANLMNMPPNRDRDLDFYINCSSHALLNVTVRTKDSLEEFLLIANQPCHEFNERFSHSRFEFGTKKNTTIYVYLYDFKTPFHFRISFTQFLKIDLFNFFITFFGCFLSLLLVAALFWKVKQRYDLYTQRQRALIEMEKMIKRPFGTVLAKLGDGAGPFHLRALSSQLPPASVVSVEPLRESRLAVVSVLLEMPLAGGHYPPANQSGLAVASTLACIGHMKSTFEKPDLHKRKHSQPPSLDACI